MSNIHKQLLHLTIVVIFSIVGCASTEESTEQRNNQTPASQTAQKPIEQQARPALSSKVDTVMADIQPPTKPAVEPTSSTETIPSGNFAVQIGAYKMPDNADRIASLAKERFGKSVQTIYDKATDLYKVMVGDFFTREEARSFRDAMVDRFPGDYKDAWVAEIPKQ